MVFVRFDTTYYFISCKYTEPTRAIILTFFYNMSRANYDKEIKYGFKL